jgi:hypothetical protein
MSSNIASSVPASNTSEHCYSAPPLIPGAVGTTLNIVLADNVVMRPHDALVL